MNNKKLEEKLIASEGLIRLRGLDSSHWFSALLFPLAEGSDGIFEFQEGGRKFSRLIRGCSAGLSSHIQVDKSQTCHSHFPFEKKSLNSLSSEDDTQSLFLLSDCFFFLLPTTMWHWMRSKNMDLKIEMVSICQVSSVGILRYDDYLPQCC